MWEPLGPIGVKTLNRIVGTSLDKGVELNALKDMNEASLDQMSRWNFKNTFDAVCVENPYLNVRFFHEP